MPRALAAPPGGCSLYTDKDIKALVRQGRKAVEKHPDNQGYVYSHWQLRQTSGQDYPSLQLRYRCPGSEDSYTTLWSCAL